MKPQDKLVQFWKAQGLRIAQPADERFISAFEAKYGVRFPADMRDYFASVNGMHPIDTVDANGFAFWPISQVKDLVSAWPDPSTTPPGSTEHYFVFADYLHWSWAYAVQLWPDAAKGGAIITVGTIQRQVVAPTFTTFVDLYLNSAVELFPRHSNLL